MVNGNRCLAAGRAAPCDQARTRGILVSISYGLTRVSLLKLWIGEFQTETSLVTDEGGELGAGTASEHRARFMDKTYLAGRGIERIVDDKRGHAGRSA